MKMLRKLEKPLLLTWLTRAVILLMWFDLVTSLWMLGISNKVYESNPLVWLLTQHFGLSASMAFVTLVSSLFLFMVFEDYENNKKREPHTLKLFTMIMIIGLMTTTYIIITNFLLVFGG